MVQKTPEVKILRTKKTLSSAVRQRHPWVFRDAFTGSAYNDARTNGGKISIPQASPVRVLDHGGRYLGDGLFEAEGEIAVRFWNYQTKPVTEDSVRLACKQAIQRRERLWKGLGSNAIRLIHGESDGVPGVVADSFDGHVVVQFHSLASELFCDGILPQIFSRQKYKSLQVKGLSSKGGELKEVFGKCPKEIQIHEGACQYLVNLSEGQKTGFYLDLREARRLVGHLVTPESNFLNLFGYTGAFTLQALKAQARDTLTVDQAGKALEALAPQAVLNGFDPKKARVLAADVRDVLKELTKKGELFDVVICDPPAFVHNKAQKSKGWDAYLALYAQTLKVVREGGVVGFGNCSAQIASSEFELLMEQAALEAKVLLYRLYDVGQPADHPVRVGFPEGRYLKFQYFSVQPV